MLNTEKKSKKMFVLNKNPMLPSYENKSIVMQINWPETIWTLSKKFPYSELFWSIFNQNAGKYGPK